MERLTFKLGNSYGLEDKASSKVGLFTDYDGFYAYLVSTNRLGAYEDTGLTPEEITSIQKENEELKKEVKLWEQGREAIANQAKLVEKISFENSKKYFEEKAKKDKLAELLKLAIEDMKSLSKNFGICHHCINSSGYRNRCKLGKTVNASFCNDWQWQHADKLKELGVEV